VIADLVHPATRDVAGRTTTVITLAVAIVLHLGIPCT
jgi:hypothetical protein